MSTKTPEATATPDVNAELETLRAENARLQKEREEADTARRAEAEKNARLEAEALRGRLAAKAERFEGDQEAHVAHMEKLCGAFGEESAELAHYVTVCTAQAEQIRTGDLFVEKGSSVGAGDGKAKAALQAKAAELQKLDSTLTAEQALDLAYRQNPKLYANMVQEEG